MEPQLTQRQLQLIQYVTRSYMPLQRQPVQLVIQLLTAINVAEILSSATFDENNLSIFPVIFACLYLLILLGYQGSVGVSSESLPYKIDFLGKYFQRHYGEIELATIRATESSPKKPAYQSYLKYIVMVVGGLLAIPASLLISVFLRLNGAAIVATIYTVITFFQWLKKPDRQVQFYYPLVEFFLTVFLWLPLFSNNFANDHTAQTKDLFLVIYLNLALLVAFISLSAVLPQILDVLRINQTFKKIPQAQRSVVVEPNGDMPPAILQTMLAVLAICENVDNLYLQRLTGLNRTNITLILVQLQNASFVYIQEQEIKKGGTRLIVSLTATGTEAAHMVTTNLALATA